MVFVQNALAGFPIAQAGGNMGPLFRLLANVGIASGIGFVISIAILWRIFVKAGQPGWAAIIPVYDILILLRIVGRPGWWLLLALIPCFTPLFYLYIVFLYPFELAKSFGKDAIFAIGLIFISPVFYAILAFGSAEYEGPVVGENVGRPRNSPRSVARFDDEDDEDEDDRRRRSRRDDDDEYDDEPRLRRR